MPRFRSLNALFLAAALLVAGCAGTQQAADDGMDADDDPAMTDDGDIRRSQYPIDEIEYPALRDFQVPEVEEMTLDNGMKVFLIEDRELPTVSASARMKTGSVWAPADHAGLASITGTTMRTGGTQSMSSDEINQLLENLGATVETSIGETSGSAYMNTLAENVDQVLPVFVDVLANPAFAQEKVELAKQQTRSAISRRNDNPNQIVSREFEDLVYGEDSPYARTTEYYTLDEISREDVMNFHEQYVQPQNTMLSVWGDFDTAQMKQQIREAFGAWEGDPGFEEPELPQPEADERDYSVHFVNKPDVTQSTVRMGYLGELTQDDEDYFPVIVMNEVLSGGFTSRLFKNVRTDQGLAYSVGGSYTAGYETPGPFYAGVGTKSSTTVEAAQSVLTEIEKMRQSPPSEDEVQLAKDSFLNSFVFNFDTRSEILGRLMTYEAYDYPRDFLQQTREGVANVTPQDVYRVSQAYLHPDQMDILVLGNRDEFDEPLSTLAKGGEVEEVDISIPTSPPGEAEEEMASQEDRAAGQDLLAQVREAMGGSAYDDIENLRQSLETQAGSQTIAQTIATDLAGQIHAEVETPQGTVTIIDTGEQAYMQMGGNTRPAPAQLRRQFLSGLQQDLTYLMSRAGELEAAGQGTQTVDGTEYRALRITPPQGSAFTMLVNPDTMMPERLVSQAQGQEVMTVLSDFREQSGVMVPYERAAYQGGQQRATTTVTGFETNVDFPDGYFTVDQ